MNSRGLKAALLERALLEKLNQILGGISWLSSPPSPRAAAHRGDATIEVGSSTGTRAVLRVHVKSEMRPSTFPAWAAAQGAKASGPDEVQVLAMPFVSARLADLCRRINWSWLDLSGNCWLDVPGALHVERSGNLPVPRPRRRGANLSTPEAARVMRVLLSPGHAGWDWKQRALELETCWPRPNGSSVSLGLVNKVLRHLRDEGYVTYTAGRGVRLHDPVGLLRAWSDAYRFGRQGRLAYFTLLKRRQLTAALNRAGLDAGGLVAYAAFSAAERQAPQVRQPRTWLYAAAEHVDVLAKHARAKEVDTGENLVVLVPDDLGVFLSWLPERPTSEASLGCTDPVQTYVDLMHCGGRGEEAAEAVLEQCILPAWRRAGLA